MQGLEHLQNLRILDLANNALEDLNGVEHLSVLEDLWLNDNQLKDMSYIIHVLVTLSAHLTCVYLAGNPATQVDASYKQKLPGILPGLQQLDSDIVPR